MAGMEKLNTFPIVCEGGLDSNLNYLKLSRETPGRATTLINFEPGLFGGYRRINGYTALSTGYTEVDSAGAEGKIYGLAIYNGDIIAARKQQAGATYKFYQYSDAAPWAAYTTGLTHTSTSVNKIRNTTFNFSATEEIIFVDGVNKALIFNGTTWVFIDPAGTGLNYANAGGAQALPAPKYITTFKNHIFMAGDATNPNVLAHSAPNAEYDWLSASGAGQLVADFEIQQIIPFRDELYVFGTNKIKKVIVESSTFVFKDVTKRVGCLAPDSVIEINGDLLFLSQDGLRTVSATERIDDIEIGSQTKLIQQDMIDLIEAADLTQVCAMTIRRKSQVRYFFSDENLDVSNNVGVLGSITKDVHSNPNSQVWEWARTLGFKVACCASDYIGSSEYIVHGDYAGNVFRQEIGSDFNGASIPAVYEMPYLDLGDVFIRKTIHKVTVFVRPEGTLTLNAALQFDWDSEDVLNPVGYTLENTASGALYGTAVYGTDTYVNQTVPVLIKNMEGSGLSCKLTFSTNGMQESYSIQAVVFEFSVNGRK